ncbi:MAG: MarR family winged helix-turn-helix transcriptional regulator [Cyanobacteria bacterium P01_E01_bin.42]
MSIFMGLHMDDTKCSVSKENQDALGLAQADLLERVSEVMKNVSRAYVKAIIASLSEEGFDELTPASVSLLARLTPDGSQTVDLARQVRRTKQATGKLVQALENQGYAERAPDPNDSRAQLVRPTDKGKKALAAGVGIRKKLAEDAMTVFGSEALEKLHDDLTLLEDIFKDKVAESNRDADAI